MTLDPSNVCERCSASLGTATVPSVKMGHGNAGTSNPPAWPTVCARLVKQRGSLLPWCSGASRRDIPTVSLMVDRQSARSRVRCPGLHHPAATAPEGEPNIRFPRWDVVSERCLCAPTPRGDMKEMRRLRHSRFVVAESNNRLTWRPTIPSRCSPSHGTQPVGCAQEQRTR